MPPRPAPSRHARHFFTEKCVRGGALVVAERLDCRVARGGPKVQRDRRCDHGKAQSAGQSETSVAHGHAQVHVELEGAGRAANS